MDALNISLIHTIRKPITIFLHIIICNVNNKKTVLFIYFEILKCERNNFKNSNLIPEKNSRRMALAMRTKMNFFQELN